jgi:hypothetical protein
MPIITQDISRTFIETVKLVAPPARPRAARSIEDTPPVELKSTDAQSLVVGSGLIVAADQVPAETRRDLVNCTLFAQLAASGEVSDPTDVPQWYTAYFRTLTALGWAQSDTHFEDYQFGSQNAEAHEAIMKVLTVVLGPQAVALTIVQTVIEALHSMNENSPWITLFDRQSKAGRSARFQVATAQLGPGGLLQTALVGFDLKAEASLTQVLFFKFKSSATSLKYAAGRATIYEQALAGLRDSIAERLAAYRSAYIGQVKFPPPPVSPARSIRAAGPAARSAAAPAAAGADTARVRRYLLE